MAGGTFAVKLKRLREAAGLSQPELAARAGMNQYGVAKLEQGVREPSWATVQALAAALGVSCEAFMDRPARRKKGGAS
jgi:transcriptional regulator with XRE-family HTH domain